jgi:hypothetical protein
MYPFIITGKKIIVGNSLPATFSSIFGWILIGPVSDVKIGPVHSLLVSLTASIEGLMAKFWHVEEPVAAPKNLTGEGRCETIFRDQFTRLPLVVFQYRYHFAYQYPTAFSSAYEIPQYDVSSL